ncbi:hypothetical protein [Nocardia sp. NBC_00403]|uniref:hypothetical protein n=1 Tax=Nocardia sp. NBC_00403 TaxID=2975990 RepID=UPI002E22734A
MRTPTEAAARLRGAFVGSASGAVSIAAHALAGGTVSPGRSALALLLAACTLTGAVVASMRTRHGVVEVMAMLAIGQTVGHLALSMSAGHHHSTHTGGAMLMAHLITIPVGGLLIHSAQRAITGAASSAVRAVGVLGTGPLAPRTPALAVSFSAAQTPKRLLFSSGIGTRGPPAPRWPVPPAVDAVMHSAPSAHSLDLGNGLPTTVNTRMRPSAGPHPHRAMADVPAPRQRAVQQRTRRASARSHSMQALI